MSIDNDFWSLIFDTQHIIKYGGIFLVMTIIYLETGFFIGLVLPGGDYLLFTTGVFCGSQYLAWPLWFVVLLLILGSFLGDLTGYYKGKWLGKRLFKDNHSRFFKIEYLERSNHFYARYGIWAFILGRFMPVIRTFVPMIAGASQFDRNKFMLYNFCGAMCWIGLLVPLGYYVGKLYPDIIDYSLYIMLLFILMASSPMLKILFTKRAKK